MPRKLRNKKSSPKLIYIWDNKLKTDFCSRVFMHGIEFMLDRKYSRQRVSNYSFSRITSYLLNEGVEISNDQIDFSNLNKIERLFILFNGLMNIMSMMTIQSDGSIRSFDDVIQDVIEWVDEEE